MYVGHRMRNKACGELALPVRVHTTHTYRATHKQARCSQLLALVVLGSRTMPPPSKKRKQAAAATRAKQEKIVEKKKEREAEVRQEAMDTDFQVSDEGGSEQESGEEGGDERGREWW